tara:strand:+ start:709 stop:825 length:117 start_codon:yes stop_codon:yes gene_type:complete
MLNKFLNTLFLPKEDACLDAKVWIQKILLQEKFRKNKS